MSVKCEQCDHQFEVPAENAGKPVNCPECDTPVQQSPDDGGIRIKWGDVKKKGSGGGALSLKKTESSKPKPEKPASIKLQPGKKPKSEGEPDEGLTRLNCPACDQHLKVPQELGGQSIDCPSCQQKVPVPAVTQSNAAELKTPEPYIRFNCTGCNEPMAVPSEYAGESIECPSCATSITVAAPSGVVAPAVPEGDEKTAAAPQVAEPAPVPQPPSGKSFDAGIFWKLIAQAFALKGRSLSRFGVCVGMSYAVAVVFVIIQVFFVWLRLDVRIIFLLNVLLLVSITTLVFTYIKNVIRSCGKGVVDLPSVFDLRGDSKHYRHDKEGGIQQTGEPPAFIKNIIHVLGIIWASYLLLMLTLICIYKGLVGPGAIYLAMFVSAFLFPVMLLGVAVMDSLVILINVKLLLRSLKIFFTQYLVIFAIFGAMNVLFYLLLIGWAVVSSFVWPLQFLLVFLISPAFLYQMLVLCRLLGFMYYAHRKKLKWM